MGALATMSHVPLEQDEARQVHPSVSALTRAAGRAAEELAPYLSPRKAAYTLGCVAPAGARGCGSSWADRFAFQPNWPRLEQATRAP